MLLCPTPRPPNTKAGAPGGAACLQGILSQPPAPSSRQQQPGLTQPHRPHPTTAGPLHQPLRAEPCEPAAARTTLPGQSLAPCTAFLWGAGCRREKGNSNQHSLKAQRGTRPGQVSWRAPGSHAGSQTVAGDPCSPGSGVGQTLCSPKSIHGPRGLLQTPRPAPRAAQPPQGH